MMYTSIMHIMYILYQYNNHTVVQLYSLIDEVDVFYGLVERLCRKQLARKDTDSNVHGASVQALPSAY